MQSKFLSLNQLDLFKAAFLAAIVAALTSLMDIFASNALPTIAQLKTAGLIAGTSCISYLIKNLISNSMSEIMVKEPVAPTPAVIPVAPEVKPV